MEVLYSSLDSNLKSEKLERIHGEVGDKTETECISVDLARGLLLGSYLGVIPTFTVICCLFDLFPPFQNKEGTEF
jgi:hypothetical protein